MTVILFVSVLWRLSLFGDCDVKITACVPGFVGWVTCSAPPLVVGRKRQFCICCQSELSVLLLLSRLLRLAMPAKKKRKIWYQPPIRYYSRHHLGLIICRVSCNQHLYFGTCLKGGGGGEMVLPVKFSGSLFCLLIDTAGKWSCLAGACTSRILDPGYRVWSPASHAKHLGWVST